jgi:Ca2+-transporting ATPase
MSVKVPEHPWRHGPEEVLRSLGVDPEAGLSASEVRSRQKSFGRNRLRIARPRSVWDILLSQFKSVIMLLLGAAAALSFVFGRWVDGSAISVAMLINAGIGFFTELKAVRSMESLRRMDKVWATVRREGGDHRIDAEQLVPGDVVLVESGQVITADLRLVESSKLQVDESTLTGESVPVGKRVEALDRDPPLAERSNMLYKGTSVTRGSGKAVAVATGMDTELGTITSLVEEAGEEEDPLQKRLDRLGRKLIWLVLVIAALAGGAGFVTGKELMLMIETAVTLVVAAIPEGLAIVETVALARGMSRMAGRQALVRRLSAVQTLGSTNVIFTDKTGTLTENRMTLTAVWLPGAEIEVTGSGLSIEGEFQKDGQRLDPQNEPLLRRLLEVGVLCNNASLSEQQERDGDPVGDPMEVALLVAGAKAGLHRDRTRERKPEMREVAFDPQVKMMATFHRIDGGFEVAVKGAPDAVLDRCTRLARRRDSGEADTVSMDEQQRRRWLDNNRKLAERGFRVLALAGKQAGSPEAEPYRDLTFLGLAGLFDPPRQEVRKAIDTCQAAGIRVVMVTGDQALTARKVGLAVGLIDSEEKPTLQGAELPDPRQMSRQQQERILGTSVFTRVSPEQKLKLIGAHQAAGSIVAMTGDGVNDAPALRKADIGIAMGRRGQQVAKEAADVILQDDAFATIVTAVEHGRTIFSNIRKFVLYLLSGNVGEILIVAAASLLGAPLPLLPLQILYLNAINDAFPALALGLGEAEEGIMKRRPRDPREPILTGRHWFALGGFGVLIAASVLAAFFLALRVLDFSRTQAVTVSFLSLALSRLWHVFNMREARTGLFNNQVVKNSYVWGALALCVILILMAVFVPVLRQVLGLTVLPALGWYMVFGFSLLPLLVGQLILVVARRIST